MKLLLDTHAFYWCLFAPDKLSSASRSAIEDRGHTVFFSAASIWELSIKAAKHALVLPEGVLEAADKLNFTELPVRASHGWAIRSLPRLHNDPFDRLLAAQARLEQLTLVTRDRFLARYNIAILEE